MILQLIFSLIVIFILFAVPVAFLIVFYKKWKKEKTYSSLAALISLFVGTVTFLVFFLLILKDEFTSFKEFLFFIFNPVDFGIFLMITLFFTALFAVLTWSLATIILALVSKLKNKKTDISKKSVVVALILITIIIVGGISYLYGKYLYGKVTSQNTTPEELKRLWDSKTFQSYHIYYEIYGYGGEIYIEGIARNPNTPPEVLKEIYLHYSPIYHSSSNEYYSSEEGILNALWENSEKLSQDFRESIISKERRCLDIISEDEVKQICPQVIKEYNQDYFSNLKFNEVKNYNCYDAISLKIDFWEDDIKTKQEFEYDLVKSDIKKKDNVLGYSETSALTFYKDRPSKLNFIKDTTVVYIQNMKTIEGNEFCSENQLIEIGKKIYERLS